MVIVCFLCLGLLGVCVFGFGLLGLSVVCSFWVVSFAFELGRCCWFGYLLVVLLVFWFLFV